MKKRIWMKIVAIFISIIATVSSQIVPAKAGSSYLPLYGKNLERSPLSESFVKFLKGDNTDIPAEKLENSNKNFGVIPDPIKLPNIKPPRLSGVTTFPSTYDLRTMGKLTSIKDQNPAGTCWAFATYGSLESCLLPWENRDYSENNLKNTHGFDYGANDGGNSFMSTAYLARWSGPVFEADDPYNPYSTYSPPGKPAQKHVQEVIWLPSRTSSSDNDAIKDAVMKYGAVHVGFYWEDGSYSSTYNTYYDQYSWNKTNHSVDIVGWNDSFDRFKFYDPYYKAYAPENGAFIVRNSWGSSWGENGYFYISYYDKNLGIGNNAVYNGAQLINNYSRVYQYDPLGYTGSMGYEAEETAWFANVFTAAASESLAAASFYTVVPNASYEVFVCSDYNGINDLSSDRILKASGTSGYAGYHTITLNSGVPIQSGKQFAIIVKLTTPGYDYPIPIEENLAGYSSAATAGTGQSFYSLEGSSWGDLTTISGFSNTNVCIKAFTSSGDIQAPYVSSTVPANGATGIAVNNNITVKFSETIQSGAAFSNITVKNPSGTAVTCSNTISGDTLTINPNSDLAGNTLYTVTIPVGAVKDSAGNALASQYSFNFTTANTDITAPSISSTIPANGAGGVSVSNNISIKFSEPIIIGSAYSSITIKNAGGTSISFSPTISGDTLTLDPVGSLAAGMLYTVTIPASAVKDAANNNLASQYIFSFTTAGGNAIIPKLVFDKTAYAPNSNVKLDVKFTGITTGDKTNSVTFTIDFDSSAFELATGNVNNDIQSGYLPITTRSITGGNTTKQIVVMYTDMSKDTYLIEDGTLFSINLKVKSTTTFGDKTFTLEPVQMLDSSFKVYNVNNNQSVVKNVNIVNCAFIEGYTSIYLADKGSSLNNLILGSVSQDKINQTFEKLEFTVKRDAADSGTKYYGKDIFIKDAYGNLASKNATGEVLGKFNISTTQFDGKILSIAGAGYLAKNRDIIINPGDTTYVSTQTSSIVLYPGDVGSLAGGLSMQPDGKIDNIDFSAWLKVYNDNLSGTASSDNVLYNNFTKDSKLDNIDFSLWLASYKSVYGVESGIRRGIKMVSQMEAARQEPIKPQLIFNKENYKAGETVNLSIKLTGIEPGCKTNSVMFEMLYDDKAFELIDIKDGGIPFTSRKDIGFPNGRKIQAMYVNMNNDIELKEGATVLTASFKVKKGVRTGEKKFVLQPVNMLDSNFNTYNVNSRNSVEGIITIGMEKSSLEVKKVNITDSDNMDIASKEPIVVTFSDNIIEGNSYRNIRLVYENKNVKIGVTIVGNMLMIQPLLQLYPNSSYTLIIPKNAVTNNDGTSLEKDYKLNFRTGR